MKKRIAKLLVGLMLVAFSATSSYSQGFTDEVVGCLVSDVTGKVTYTEKGNATPKPVTAGTVLPEDATVTVGKKSRFILICDDRSLSIKKKGVHTAAVLAKEVSEKGEVSKFAKMAFAAKGYGEVDTTKKKKLWSEKDSLLIFHPISGKVPLQALTINWSPLKMNAAHRVVISQNDALHIFSEQTEAAQLTVSLQKLNLKVGETYQLQVQSASNPAHKSATVTMTITDEKEIEGILKNLHSSASYKKASKSNRQLLEAAELEENGFSSSAKQRYERVLIADANNVLAKKMYASFLDKFK